MHSVGAFPWLLMLVLCSVVLSFLLFILFLSADIYGLTILESLDYTEAFGGYSTPSRSAGHVSDQAVSLNS